MKKNALTPIGFYLELIGYPNLIGNIKIYSIAFNLELKLNQVLVWFLNEFVWINVDERFCIINALG